MTISNTKISDNRMWTTNKNTSDISYFCFLAHTKSRTCADGSNGCVCNYLPWCTLWISLQRSALAGLVWISVALRPQRRVGLLGTGTEWEGGEGVKGSTAETARKRPERPWTAARTTEVLRRCPLAIAQRLVHCAIAVSTAVLDRVTKTMSVAPLLTNNLDNSKQKTSNLLSPAPPPYSWSLLGKCEGPAPPPSSKISWSFDLAWNHDTLTILAFYIAASRDDPSLYL